MSEKLTRKLIETGAATRAQIKTAERLFEDRGGVLASWLVDAGVSASQVLDAMSSISGYPVASLLDMARARMPDGAAKVPAAKWFSVRAVPIGEDAGRVKVAIPTPEVAAALDTLGLSDFAPLLAVEADIRTVQARLLGEPPADLVMHADGFDEAARTQAVDVEEATVAREPQHLSGSGGSLPSFDDIPRTVASDEGMPGASGFEDDAPTMAVTADDVDTAMGLPSNRPATQPKVDPMVSEADGFDDGADPTMMVDNSGSGGNELERNLAELDDALGKMGLDDELEDLDAPTAALSAAEIEAAMRHRHDAVETDPMGPDPDLAADDGGGEFDEPTFAMDPAKMDASMLQMHGDKPTQPVPQPGQFDEPTIAAPDLAADAAVNDALLSGKFPKAPGAHDRIKEAIADLPTQHRPVEEELQIEDDGDSSTVIVDIDDSDESEFATAEAKMVDEGIEIDDDFDDGTEVLDIAALPAPQAQVATQDEPETDTPNVEGYRLGRILGEGGMATVYLARDLKKQRDVALKVMSPELSDDELFVERFKRETRAAASMRSGHIIRVYEYGCDAGSYFMATEVMDGGTLRSMVKQVGRVPFPLAVAAMDNVFRGLSRAHEDGVTHRDIKPGNIMLSSEGIAKIGDFGIAKMETDSSITRTGALFGTPAYMSPEQTLGRQLDGRSDLFSAGIILYELLAGLNPYVADSASATLLRVSRAAAPSVLAYAPGIPRDLLDVVEKIQTRDVSRRYQTANEALADLDPIFEKCESLFPNSIRSFVEDPQATVEEMRTKLARDAVTLSRSLLVQVPARAEEAGYWAHAARRTAPRDDDAKRQLDRVCSEHRFNFEPTADPRVREAERELDETPDDQTLIRKLADLYRDAGNPHLAAAFIVQYLRKNDDATSRQQLDGLIGRDGMAPLNPVAAPHEEEPPTPGVTEWELPGMAADEASPGLPDLDLPEPDGMPGLPGGPGAPPPPAGLPPSGPLSEPSIPSPMAGYSDDEAVRMMMEGMKKRERDIGGLQVMSASAAPPGVAPAQLPPPEMTAAVRPAASLAKPKSARRDGGNKPLLIAAAIVGVIVLLSGVVAYLVLAGPTRPGLASDIPVEEQQAALLEQARAQLANGQTRDALATLNQLIAADPTTPKATEALIPRARVHLSLGNTNFAKKDLEKVVVSFQPGNAIRMEAEELLEPLKKK
jgi:serine/threonine protein kinase